MNIGFKKMNKYTLSKKIFGFNNSNYDLSIMIPTYSRVESLIMAVKSAYLQKNIIDRYNICVVNNSEDLDNKNIIRNKLLELNYDNLSYYENYSNIGMFGNWNMCINLCGTKFCTILNDDDLLDDNFIQYFRKYRHEDFLFVPRVRIYGLNNYIKNNIKKIYYQYKYFIKPFKYQGRMSLSNKLKANTVHASLGVVFNTKNAMDINGFNEEMYPIADIVFGQEYSENFGIIYLNKELATYNIEDNESMKLSVIELSLKKEHEYRMVLIDKLNSSNFRKSIGYGLSRLHYLAKKRDFEKRYNLKISNIFLMEENFILNYRFINIMWFLFSIGLK
jgi:hypothetical protein